MRLVLMVLLLSCFSVLGYAEDVMLEDFDNLTPATLGSRVQVAGDNIKVSLVKTDERAGKQNLLFTADVDPAQPNWNHIRVEFPRRVRTPQTLTFWYRGDKVARLYLIVEDSRGTRTDFVIGEGAPAGQWQQAIVPLKNMHVPNGQPPNDRATPLDVAALEVFPYPQGYPGKGVYQFQLDDISVLRGEPTVSTTLLDSLVSPVKNGDFEQLTPDGKQFQHWSFSLSRAAKATVAVSSQVRHSGKYAALFHDDSPVAPHVYSRFLQRVAVQAGTPYKLSCWVKGEGVGAGNHFTDWRTYTLNIPSGDYDWQRIETSLVTAPDQTVLEVGFNCDNVTDKLWIDDVQLSTDLTVAESATLRGAKVALWSPQSAVADRDEVPFRVLWQGFPAQEGTLRVEVHQGWTVIGVRDEGWKGSSGALEDSLPVKPGRTRQARMTAQLFSAEGKLLAQAGRSLDLLSVAYVRGELQKTRGRLRRLEAEMTRWQQRKLPLDYPAVTRTVAEQFIPWIEEDLQKGEVAHALQQVEELNTVLRAAISQALNPPPAAALTVPRYQTDTMALEDGHFVAQVQWPDGRRERRPVFFNGYGAFGSIRRDMPLLPAYGLNMIQVEFGPSSTVKEDFSLDLGACRSMEAFLDDAAKHNVAINVLLSPHYMPGWALQKWPEMGGVNGGFNSFDIDNPNARKVEETFLRGVIGRLKGHPALHSYCLSNEPIYLSAPSSPYNLRKWRDWLQAHHGTIAQVNALWGAQYKSFDEIPQTNGQDLRPRAELYDWVAFNNERFAGWHRWMADIIHEIDPATSTHAKIMNLPFDRNTLGWGNDVELFDDATQIAGNDSYNGYIGDEGSTWGNSWQIWEQYLDLLRSGRGQPSFNSENHVSADRNWTPQPGIHLRNMTWQAAIHGQGASAIWVWERTYDNASDFAGSIAHRPAFCDAHGRASLDLMRLAPEVVKIQQAPARCAILYSICSQIWSPSYPGALNDAYQALTFMGEKVDFITYRQIAKGEAEKYQVIIAPAVTHFEESAYPKLAAWAQDHPGRWLITLGPDCFGHDEYGRLRDASGLHCANLRLTDPTRLRQALLQVAKLRYPVRVLDAATGRLAWGVEWRWAQDGGRWLVNLVNHTRKPVKVRVETPGKGRQRDLFTGRALTGPVELGMMEPLLVEAR